MVGDPIDDHVKLVPNQHAAYFFSIANVGPQNLRARNIDLAPAAIEQIQIHAPRDGLPADRRADEPRAADKEKFHDEWADSLKPKGSL
jgi:hypothetical protein